MTSFENLELLYNQFYNLADEIKSMIENENYKEAISKLGYKNKLIKKLITTKKTVDLTAVDKQKLLLMDEKLKEKEQNNITFLDKLRIEVSKELNETKGKLKINTAYEIKKENNSGRMVDFSE